MKEEQLEKLGTAAVNVVEKLAVGLEKGVEMGMEHLPTIATQYISYVIAVTVAGTVAWTLLTLVMGWGTLKLWRYSTNEDNDSDNREVATIVSGVLSILLLINVILYTIGTWVNIKTAAHAYLSPVTYIAKSLAPSKE